MPDSDSPEREQREPRLVGCGWCPVLLPDDHVSWYFHFATEHGTNGYSIRHNIVSSDWDLAELADV
jgi:hypothetical protein